jgi:hypothetical protein
MVDAEASGAPKLPISPLEGGDAKWGQRGQARGGRCPAGVKNHYWRNAQADIASGLALLLGIWMSISSVDIVSPRSIETCR